MSLQEGGRRKCEKIIIVPNHAMGKVIGRSGSRIETLAKTHSCELKMLRDEAFPNGDTPLRITSLLGDYGDVLGVDRDVQDIVS
jgi:predicted PilT family ATPase